MKKCRVCVKKIWPINCALVIELYYRETERQKLETHSTDKLGLKPQNSNELRNFERVIRDLEALGLDMDAKFRIEMPYEKMTRPQQENRPYTWRSFN